MTLDREAMSSGPGEIRESGPQSYPCVVLDPPWRYASAATKADAHKHYDTMSLWSR